MIIPKTRWSDWRGFYSPKNEHLPKSPWSYALILQIEEAYFESDKIYSWNGDIKKNPKYHKPPYHVEVITDTTKFIFNKDGTLSIPDIIPSSSYMVFVHQNRLESQDIMDVFIYNNEELLRGFSHEPYDKPESTSNCTITFDNDKFS